MSVRKGTYVLLLHLPQDRIIRVGALGEMDFPPSWYAYVGSARNGLEQRVGRHLRVAGTKRWHIDYLNSYCDMRCALIWDEGGPTECRLASKLRFIGAVEKHKGFGSSDCRCGSHLFLLDPPTIHRLLELPRDGEIGLKAFCVDA